MTDATRSRTHLQLGIYPTAGRITTISSTNEIQSHHRRTCLFLNVFQHNTNTDTNTEIGVQFHVDANESTGGYIDFDTPTALHQLKQYPRTIVSHQNSPAPIKLHGTGQVISHERLTYDHPEVYPGSPQQTQLSLHLKPVSVQTKNGLALQFGTTDMEGAEITLTPHQTTHIADILTETLHGKQSLEPPESTERAVVNGHGTINPIKYGTFTTEYPHT